MDWTTLDEMNKANGHYLRVAIRNQLKAAGMIPDLMAIREEIKRIDSLPDASRLSDGWQELRSEFVEYYALKIEVIGNLCAHEWQTETTGGLHMSGGDVWDDIHEETFCTKCGLNKMYLYAPSAPEPVTF